MCLFVLQVEEEAGLSGHGLGGGWTRGIVEADKDWDSVLSQIPKSRVPTGNGTVPLAVLEPV